MSMAVVAGHSAVHPRVSIANLTTPEDDDAEPTAVDPVVTAAMAGKTVPASGLAPSVRPPPPRPRATVRFEPEPELLRTLDLEAVQPAPSVPPPLPKRAPTVAAAEPSVEVPPARTALPQRALTTARVVAFFVAYVAMAFVRWMLRAVPHVRAFALGIHGRLRSEWQRAREAARPLNADR